MRAFLDCEFNGFGGELISMALVCDGGQEFYECKQIPENLNDWVAVNVIPILGKSPVGPDVFRFMLHHFLAENQVTEIIADWPSDIELFCRELLGASHAECLPCAFTLRIIPSLTYQSETPHNALSDARALAKVA